ncbi:hypothetical protein ACJIZ3_001983 [Penstemon smallii]|uniref:Uncharacterized protein n=1 Tax=Penstemon smallii TaxID=265156 RepID=A0ABD3U5I8_9LAMI
MASTSPRNRGFGSSVSLYPIHLSTAVLRQPWRRTVVVLRSKRALMTWEENCCSFD